MKKMIVCESCAAEYDASLVRCPYCGSGYAPAEEEEFMDGQEAIRKDLDGQKEKGNASLQKGLGRMGRAVLIAMVVIAVLIGVGLWLSSQRERSRSDAKKEEFLRNQGIVITEEVPEE